MNKKIFYTRRVITVTLVFWFIYLNIFFINSLYIGYRIKSDKNIPALELVSGLKFYCGKIPFALLADSVDPLSNINLYGVKGKDELAVCIRNKNKEFSISYALNDLKDKSRLVIFTEAIDNAGECQRDLNLNDIILFDFNSDDIWDLRRQEDLSAKKIRTWIFLDGKWQECVSFDFNDKIAVLPSEVKVHWSLQTASWKN